MTFVRLDVADPIGWVGAGDVTDTGARIPAEMKPYVARRKITIPTMIQSTPTARTEPVDSTTKNVKIRTTARTVGRRTLDDVPASEVVVVDVVGTVD